MERILKQFTTYLDQLGYNWHSVHRGHNYHAKEYLWFIKKQGITEITQTDIHEVLGYEEYLRKRENKVVGGKLGEKTIYDHLRSIELLYEFLQIHGMVATNPVSQLDIKAPANSQRRIIVTEEEINQLYKASETAKEKTILSLSYGCGLRVGALERLELRDLKLEDQYLIVRRAKGNKRRLVPMSIGVIRDIEKYLRTDRPRLMAERHYKKGNSSVMLNEIGRTMKEWNYNRALQVIAKRTENEELIQKRITTHVMRHSIATHLLHRGLDVHQVRIFLGHVLLKTTQIYTHVTPEMIMKVGLSEQQIEQL